MVLLAYMETRVTVGLCMHVYVFIHQRDSAEYSAWEMYKL